LGSVVDVVVVDVVVVDVVVVGVVVVGVVVVDGGNVVVVVPGIAVVDVVDEVGGVVVVVDESLGDRALIDDAVTDVGAKSSPIKRLPKAATRSGVRHNLHSVYGFTTSIYSFGAHDLFLATQSGLRDRARMPAIPKRNSW